MSVAGDLIPEALDATWLRIDRTLQDAPLSLWNESVFRFLFIRSLLSLRPDVRLQTEWDRFDLLAQLGDGYNLLIEFKFYLVPFLF